GLDPLAPPPPERSTLEAVTLLGEQRADLARRLTDLLHERAATEGAAAGTPAVADRAAALAVATGVLAELERDLGRPLALWEGDPDVEPVADHGDDWVVMWNSVDYLRSKDFSEQVLMGPVVVPKDGRPWFVPPTAYPTEEAVDRGLRGALRPGAAPALGHGAVRPRRLRTERSVCATSPCPRRPPPRQRSPRPPGRRPSARRTTGWRSARAPRPRATSRRRAS